MYGWSINSYKWISLYDLVWLMELIFCMMEIVRGKEKKCEWGWLYDLYFKMVRYGWDF